MKKLSGVRSLVIAVGIQDHNSSWLSRNKKIIPLLFLLLATCMSAFCQGHSKKNKVVVPDQTKVAFSQDFAKATNVQWGNINQFTEVFFTDAHGHKKIAFYDNDNELVGTQRPASIKDLPPKSIDKIKKYYKGYTIEQVVYFDDNEDNDTDFAMFGTTFDKDDYYAVLNNKENAKKVVVQIDPAGGILYEGSIK